LEPVTGEAEWLDVEAAARFLHFHPNTVYRMVRDGRLPALRFPVRIHRMDLETCLERCRIKPGELAHLNQYARRTHLAPVTGVTRSGAPDRRYGPRAPARGGTSDSVTSGSKPDGSNLQRPS
jgi:excisionase family DNA binding protein